MRDIFVERRFDRPLTRQDVIAMAAGGSECFARHRVEWWESLLAADGAGLLCHLTAPDAEAVRIVFRLGGTQITRVWAGTLHAAVPERRANVAVARRFDAPVDFEAVQALEERGRWCLDVHRVVFERTFFSLDRQRMLCLYRAPDAEAVRQAQRQAGMPVERIEAFMRISRDDLPGR